MSEKPEECEACFYPTQYLREYDASDSVGHFQGKKKYICDVCASTEIGRILDYPRQYEGQAATMRTIGYTANMIIDYIRGRH